MVNIYRYRDIEYKLKHQFLIKFATNISEEELTAETEIKDFPHSIRLSGDA